ncbi:MAG: polyphosphate polymerase domain-containing protein [Clostridia bacterium]|nr:polyphosphate polymerase domain-containing protein [Clostridia bacterium]
MGNSLKFRNELKYRCSISELEILKHRISSIMKLDEHAPAGGYCVRSIYFDTHENRCFFENENGTDIRHKYRIRIYDADDSRIALEQKSKIRGKTHKETCLLTSEQYNILVHDGDLAKIKSNDPLLDKFVYLKKTQLMHPVTIVEYDRIPFVFSAGNVRVTFDMNIRSSNSFDCFFNKNLPGRQILPAGQHLLEVKYDEFLPDFIKSALALDDLRQVTFSKYCLCRKFSM